MTDDKRMQAIANTLRLSERVVRRVLEEDRRRPTARVEVPPPDGWYRPRVKKPSTPPEW